MLTKQGAVVLFLVAVAWIGVIVAGFKPAKCDIRVIDSCARNGGLQ